MTQSGWCYNHLLVGVPNRYHHLQDSDVSKSIFLISFDRSASGFGLGGFLQVMMAATQRTMDLGMGMECEITILPCETVTVSG